MTAKLIAFSMLICSVAISTVNFKAPKDYIFAVVAGGIVAAIIRVILAIALVAITYVKLPKNKEFRNTLSYLGSVLAAFGVIGFATNSFDYSWYNRLEPLDYLFLIESGIVLNLLALQHHKAYRKKLIWSFPPYNHLIIPAFKIHMRRLKST
jgi:hypothetical protein